VNEDESYFFRVTEAIFVGWFTLEYIIRFLVAPDKVKKLYSVCKLCTKSMILKGLGHQMITFLQSYNIQAIRHVIFRMPG
jgi:hypothetical protein